MKDRHDNELDDRKFMVAIWAAGGQGPSTTFVMLDLEGNVVDMLYCGQLSGNIVKLRDYSPREREEQQATRKFDERFLYQRHIEDDPRKVCCFKTSSRIVTSEHAILVTQSSTLCAVAAT